MTGTTRQRVGVGVHALLAAILLSACASGGSQTPANTPARNDAPNPDAKPTQTPPTPTEPATPDPAGVSSGEPMTPAPSSDDGRLAWRPAWWIETPRREGALLSLCAMGEGASTLEARRDALARGGAMVERELGRPASTGAARIDALRLPDGRWRVFVRLAEPL